MRSLLPVIQHIVLAAEKFQADMATLLDPNRATDVCLASNAQEAHSLIRHDLCTPLTAVKGYAELLGEDAEAARALVPNIQKIIATASQLAEQLEIIIDFSSSRMSNGPAPVASDAASEC